MERLHSNEKGAPTYHSESAHKSEGQAPYEYDYRPSVGGLCLMLFCGLCTASVVAEGLAGMLEALRVVLGL